MHLSLLLTTMFFLLASPLLADASRPFWKWSLSEAVKMLNSSAWARNETYTRVVRGVGSGVSGEKEIYNTFYVRFLSAEPIREAYARVQQVQRGYDNLKEDQKAGLNKVMQSNINLDVSQWIVVSVTFRSNDPNEESMVRRFFQSETTETLRNKAFLSTVQFPQVQLQAYLPPRDDSIGAKFIFPRNIGDVSLANLQSGEISFELMEVPGAEPRLRASFPVKDMVVDNKLIF